VVRERYDHCTDAGGLQLLSQWPVGEEHDSGLDRVPVHGFDHPEECDLGAREFGGVVDEGYP
jgi:hypothetical protein